MNNKPLHFPDKHFTGFTIDQKPFVYCPVGNICSWSVEDYAHKWCHYCGMYFAEIKHKDDQNAGNINPTKN